MTEEIRSVRDASALLAYLHDEPGAQAVEEALAVGAAIGSVNWAEVLSKLVDDTGSDLDAILRSLQGLELLGGLLGVEPLTEEDAVTIARLRPGTRPFRLSMADRAGLALALRLGTPILTADHAWQQVRVGVSVQLIR